VRFIAVTHAGIAPRGTMTDGRVLEQQTK